jgi:hypothetical protein
MLLREFCGYSVISGGDPKSVGTWDGDLTPVSKAGLSALATWYSFSPEFPFLTFNTPDS